jgi:biopolymer transport protein ExbD
MISSKNNKPITVNEPNLIPLLDFMLVLVVMFVLLTGPVSQAIKLPLPEVKKDAVTNIEKELLLITLINKNNIYVDKAHFTSIEAVGDYLKTRNHKVTEVTIAIDKHLEVDTLLKLFAINKSLGIITANIQVEVEQKL